MQDFEFVQQNIHKLKPHMSLLEFQAYLNLGEFVAATKKSIAALNATALKTGKPVFDETATALEEVLQRVITGIAEEIRSIEAPA